ncbi:MAG: hypothetical protein AAGA97_02945 [Pseudomonadota bacterium]
MPGQRNSDPKLIDRERFDALTDADIARQIEADPDLAPELTADDLRRAQISKPAKTAE